MSTSMDHEATANEFLNQWEKAHVDRTDNGHPDYARLRDKYAIYTGQVSIADSLVLKRALHEGRKARGWPDPKLASPKGYMADVAIEDAIMCLWVSGLRTVSPGGGVS